MNRIRVALKERSYSILFGTISSGFGSAVRSLGFSRGARAFLVTTKAVQRAGHASKVKATLQKGGFRVETAVLPNGESHKNLDTLKTLFKEGLAAGLDRKSLVVAVGGGVVTDLAGFFAATYMRGIAYISVPTTLLAMVDASIGGKTGVDLLDGKNLVGAFWQPKFVWIDVALLNTLPAREMQTGMAEVIKYGVIKDKSFFRWLEQKINRNSHFEQWPINDVFKAIYRSAAIKARVVSGDEREAPLAGGREILNFGHTAGHALEAAFGYKKLSHGEAISIGMNFAGRIALRRRKWDIILHSQLLRVLSAVGLPTKFPRLNAKQERIFWESLQKDKKHIGGKLRFVLPEDLGRVEVVSGIPVSVVRAAVKETTKYGYSGRPSYGGSL